MPLALEPVELARYGDLSGVSIDAEVSCNGGRFREHLLFTHRGLSGPAILQISSYWNGGHRIHVDLLPGIDAGEWLRGERESSAGVAALLAQRLPQRFAQQWSHAARRCAAPGGARPVTGREAPLRDRRGAQ